MTPHGFQRVAALFEQAIELPAGERRAFLDRTCGDDAALRGEVESLLAAEGSAGDFLNRPAFEQSVLEKTTRPRAAPTPSGRTAVGPYRLLRQIGEGGMSTVYLAVRDDDAYRQEVAIKVFAFGRERSDLLKRFRTERQILASLEHPSIARLLDGGTTEDGLPYIVMELVEGEPIDAYCNRLRLSVDQRIELFRTLCAAVRYAHQNLVVHRDIKPSNVLVTATGEPKLMDFGIAKLVNPERFPETIQRTATGQRLMTPQFASPEQVQGAPITTASDVYSMGVLLYGLLTGHIPYRITTQNTAEIEKAVIDQEPERPSIAVGRPRPGTGGSEATPEQVSRARHSRPDRLRRRLAGDLDNIVLKALRKEPQRRYGSIEQLDEDLRRYQQGLPVLARPSSLSYRSRKFLRRHRFGAGAAAAFLLLVVGFAVAMWIQANRIAHERDQARLERDKAREVAGFLEEIFEVSDPGEARGETITAREVLERGARRIDRELAGHPEIQATLAGTIGGVYRQLGLYDDAEPLLRRSLAVRRELFGREHPEVADSLSGLGQLLRDRGEFEEAEALLREALELRRRTLDAGDPAVADSLGELAALAREAGDFQAAETLLLEALEIRRASPGGDPGRLAETLANLGEVYTQTEDLEESGRLVREALTIAQGLHGELHPTVATYMNNLAVVLGIQGRYAEAEPYLSRALELRRRLYGEVHPDVSEGLNNLGRLRQVQGDPAAARELFEQAVEIQRQLDDRTPRTSAYLANLGFLLEQLGDPAGAERCFREALAFARESPTEGHAFVGVNLRGLGTALLAQGKLAEAEPLLRESLTLLRATFSDDHRWVADSESALGEYLTALGRFDEAEPLVVSGYRKLAANPGSEGPRTERALERVIALYEAWGRSADAEAYRARRATRRRGRSRRRRGREGTRSARRRDGRGSSGRLVP